MRKADGRSRRLRASALTIIVLGCALSASTAAARSPQVMLSRRAAAGARSIATPRLPAADPRTEPTEADSAARSPVLGRPAADAPATRPARAVFRKEPYLIFGGDAYAIDVHWQLYAAAPCTVDWGLDPGYSLGSAVTAEYGTDHQHGCTLSDLAPSTAYFYRVRSGGDSRAGSFRSSPPADDTRLKFLAYGDTRSFPAVHDSVAARIIAVYEADPEYQTFRLMTGDLVNGGDQEVDWDAQFFDPTYASLVGLHANLPVQSVRGNHEASATLFAKYLPYPYVMGRAWSFDYGPAHVVVVDQYTDYSPGSPQWNWIDDDLAATDKPWRFICLHEPGWSAGSHGNDEEVQLYLQPICTRHNVAIVFAGHNHYYARAVVDGVQHVTTGGGGAPLYTPDPEYPYVVTTAEAHHFCKIEIHGDELTFTAEDTAGQVIDSFTLPTTGIADETAALPALFLSPPSPSPSSGETALAFTLAEPGHVELAIHDAGGRIVRSLLAESLPAGEHSVTWHGESDAGDRVASGVYFARLTGPGGSATRKIVRIH